MKPSEGTPSQLVFATDMTIMVAGAVLLLLGEAWEDWAVLIIGAALTVISIPIYYLSCETRTSFERGWRRLNKWTKILILLGSVTPWLLMYYFITPIWDALLVTFLAMLVCLLLARWWKPKGPEAGAKDKASAPRLLSAVSTLFNFRKWTGRARHHIFFIAQHYD